MVSTKKVNPTTGGEASKPTRRKISMHGAVITTAEYKTKIAEAQKKPEAKAKNKRKNTQVTQKKPQKKQRKSLKMRLREMKKSAINEDQYDILRKLRTTTVESQVPPFHALTIMKKKKNGTPLHKQTIMKGRKVAAFQRSLMQTSLKQ